MPSRAAAVPRPWLRALLWLWLGALIGGMGLFGVVTRVAFEVVPEPSVAGELVRRLLGPVLAIGAVSGVALAGLGAALGRGRLAIAIPLLVSLGCIVNQFGVARAVAEIELTDPALAPGMAARFAMLHQLSVWLFVGSGLMAVALAALHAWIETRAIAGSEAETL